MPDDVDPNPAREAQRNAAGRVVRVHDTVPEQAHAGEYFVLAPGQRPQHARRVGGVGGFSEHLAIHDHRRVGAENDFVIGPFRRNRLGDRQPGHIVARRFARTDRFVDVGGTHVEIKAGGAKQVGATR